MPPGPPGARGDNFGTFWGPTFFLEILAPKPIGAMLHILGNVTYSEQCYLFWALLHILGFVTYSGACLVFGALLHIRVLAWYLGLCYIFGALLHILGFVTYRMLA